MPLLTPRVTNRGSFSTPSTMSPLYPEYNNNRLDVNRNSIVNNNSVLVQNNIHSKDFILNPSQSHVNGLEVEKKPVDNNKTQVKSLKRVVNSTNLIGSSSTINNTNHSTCGNNTSVGDFVYFEGRKAQIINNVQQKIQEELVGYSNKEVVVPNKGMFDKLKLGFKYIDSKLNSGESKLDSITKH